MDNVTDEFGDLGQVALLFGKPQQRRMEQGMRQRFVVSDFNFFIGCSTLV